MCFCLFNNALLPFSHLLPPPCSRKLRFWTQTFILRTCTRAENKRRHAEVRLIRVSQLIWNRCKNGGEIPFLALWRKKGIPFWEGPITKNACGAGDRYRDCFILMFYIQRYVPYRLVTEYKVHFIHSYSVLSLRSVYYALNLFFFFNVQAAVYTDRQTAL